MRVVGAETRDGLLHVNLVREVPEALKPRQIEIVSVDNSKASKTITQDA